MELAINVNIFLKENMTNGEQGIREWGVGWKEGGGQQAFQPFRKAAA